MEFADRTLATPRLEHFLRRQRLNECFKSCYLATVREAFLTLLSFERINVCAVKHGFGYEVDDVSSTAQAMVLGMNVQTVAQDFDRSIVGSRIVRHEVLHLFANVVVMDHSQDFFRDALAAV
jgi:hypothetical protein